jgi:TP901 family phage tail tape measure protein
VFVEIGADPAKFFAALKGVNKSIASVGKSMQSAGTKMAALGAGVVGPIFASAAAFANVGSALNDMSARTGVATESLSVLQFAAEQTGTDMGGVETALKKMQKAIFAAGNGSKEAADALAMVGLSAGDLAGLSADQQIGKIADGLMAIQDPGTRAAVAMQIFGKSGTDILPMLEGGSAGMAAFADEAKRLGLVMDSETAAKADALGDAMDAVKSSMKMAFIQVGSAVAPILTQLAQGLAIVAANVGKFISENQAFVVSVLKGGAALFAAGTAITGIGYSLQGLSSGISLVLKGFSLFSALASPVLLVAAGIGAAVFALYKFKDQIGAALGSVAPLVQEAAGAIGQGLGPAVSGGIAALGDLASTATTTFSGIYDAISAGDLSGAMEIAMTGLQAAFFDVAGPFLTQVSEWATKFQGIFDDIGTGIAVAMESADGFFKKNVADLGNPQAWGAAPAIGGVPASSKEELAKRAEGIQSQTDRNVAAMEADAKDRSGKRIAAASDYALSLAAKKTAAKSSLSSLVSGKTETRAKNSQVDDLLSSIKGATSMDQLAGVGSLSDEFTSLRDLGRLTSQQETMLSDALDKAAEGLTGTATAGANGAGDQSKQSMGAVAGTFSSLNLGATFGGSSLAERTAKAAEETAKGVKDLVGQGGGKVAA